MGAGCPASVIASSRRRSRLMPAIRENPRMRLFLRRRLRRPALSLATPIILIGLAGTAVAVVNRSGDPVFVAHQRNLAGLQPAALAHLVTLAPDPQPGLGR